MYGLTVSEGKKNLRETFLEKKKCHTQLGPVPFARLLVILF